MAKVVKAIIGNKKYRFKTKAIFLLLGMGIACALVLGELIFRTIFNFSDTGPYFKFRHVRRFSVPEEVRDADLFWRPMPEFRGIKYSKQKKDGIFRIICFGDSVTQSHGRNGFPLAIEQTYPYNLELLMNKDSKKRKAEVINAGIGGYTSFQGLRYLKKELWKYQPDMLIVWFGINDDSSALFFVDKKQKLPNTEDLKKLSIWKRSILFSYLKKQLSAKMRRVEPDDYYKNCEKMLSFAREKGFKIVFVIPFEIKNKQLKYYEKYRQELEKLRGNCGANLFDIKTGLQEYSNLKELFIDNCHLTAEGNKIAAEIIFELLNNSGKQEINRSS